MKQSKNEIGRSMVEMLGVLAIIGVLSIGGISGYQTAMDQHKTNEFMNVFNIGWNEAKWDLIKRLDEETCGMREMKVGNATITWGCDNATKAMGYIVSMPGFSSGACEKVLKTININEMSEFGFHAVSVDEDMDYRSISSLKIEEMCDLNQDNLYVEFYYT